MRTNLVKQELSAGGVVLGTFVLEFNSSGIGRLAAGAGAKFAVFDMEHTGWSLETIRNLIATTRSSDLVTIVRVPATEYHFIARALDVGAMGIMVPMVESAEQARKLVECAKYPPVGRRGAVFSVAHDDYVGGGIAEKTVSANQETLLIAQIETTEGVKNVDEIAAVEGIDVLFVGPADISCSLGVPGQFDHPLVREAQKTVVEACRKHHKVPGHLPTRPQVANELIDQGFRFLAYGVDLWLYQYALREGLQEIEEHLKNVGQEKKSK